MGDLLGGTSGQILAKNSNTDMDFVWIANDQGDITGVTATSPLTGGGTSGAITVGIQDATTSVKGAVQLSDSTSTTSSVLASTPTATKSAYDLAASAYAPAFTNNFYAGKNKIINGNFGVWQRGTSFSTDGAYTSDRFIVDSNATFTATQQTFTPGAAPVAGYESQFYLQIAKSAGGTYCDAKQRIEDVRTFAGQTITLSAYMKVSSGTASVEPYYNQVFGTGGSAAVSATVTAQTITTSWVRYSFTFAIPSVSGKTIGAGSYLELYLPRIVTSSAVTVAIWGVQAEIGSVATPFQTSSGSIQGELAMCQRYCQVANNQFGQMYSTTSARIIWPVQVQMRVTPTVTYPTGTFTNFIEQVGIGNLTPTAFSATSTDNNFIYTNATGMTAGTLFNPIRYNGTTFIASSEL
jgi:hypothetical protein